MQIQSKLVTSAAFVTGLTWLIALPAAAQSIELEWQQTASDSSQPISKFDHQAVLVDLQAVLLSAEQRRYQHTQNLINDTHLNHIKVGGQYLYTVNDNIALWPRLQILAGYQGNLNSDSITYNPQLVGIWQTNELYAWVLGAGVLANTADTQYYPVVGMVLHENERHNWSGQLTVPQGLISYQLDTNWLADIGLKWQTRYYGLEQDEAFQIMRSQDILLSFGPRYTHSSQINLSARLTYAFEREVRFYGETGGLVTHPSSGFGFRLAMSYDF